MNISHNLTETLESAALCAMLTAETYSNRVLGQSRMITLPANMLTIATLSRSIASLRLQGNIMGCKRLGRADCIAMRSLPGV